MVVIFDLPMAFFSNGASCTAKPNNWKKNSPQERKTHFLNWLISMLISHLCYSLYLKVPILTTELCDSRFLAVVLCRSISYNEAVEKFVVEARYIIPVNF